MGGSPRRRTRARLSLIISAALAAGTLSATGAPAFADNAPPPAPANPIQAASAQAKSTGRPVTIDSMTTQTSITEALPNGSIQTTTNTLPVRVKKNSVWTAVSAALTANGDGTYSPAATPSGLKISSGGNGPLATMTDPGGHTLSWTFPFTLPKPAVSGDTATYANVLSGVDLQVTTTDQGGFSDLLIVKNAAAAANPALASINLATATRGLTLNTDSAGNITATAANGAVSFQAPTPRMWDSATTPGASAPVRRALASSRDGAANPAGSASLSVPGPGAHITVIPLTHHGSTVTLSPPASALTGSGLTFPLIIDPAVNPASSGTNGYTMVQKACPTATYWNNPVSNGERIGYNSPYWGGGCNDVMRAFYNIDTSNLNSSMVVSKATLLTSEVYGADETCSNTWPVTLNWTGGINSGTDWNNQPSVIQNLGTQNPKTAWCGTQDVNFDVTSVMKTTASNNYKTFTFGLFGDEAALNDESTCSPSSAHNCGFMGFANNPSITTVFDITPNVPTNTTATVNEAGPVNPNTQGCTTSGPYGWIGATSSALVTLSGYLVTNVQGENAHADFTVWDNNAPNNPVGSNVLKNIPNGPTVASGNNSAITINGLIDGHNYGYRVYDDDGILVSNPAPDCHFTVDLTPPVLNTASIGLDSGNTGQFTGQAWSVDLSASDPAPSSGSASGIQKITWSLLGCNQSGSVAAATGTISVTPCHWGANQIQIQAEDKADNLSQPYTFNFSAPQNPNQAATPGDLTGVGTPDLAGVDSHGNLTITTDPTHPATSTFADAPGSQAPNQLSWAGSLLAHRGSANGQQTDTLFAVQGGSLYDYYNGGGDSFTHTYSVQLSRPACQVGTNTAADCGAYNGTDWSNLVSLVAVNDPNRGNKPDLITVENDNGSYDLWFYEVQTVSRVLSTLSSPVRLSTGGWNNLQLIAPSTAPTGTLWARNSSTGSVYQLTGISLAPTASDAVTAPSGTAGQIGTGYTAAAYPAVTADGSADASGNPILYATTPTGLLEQASLTGSTLSGLTALSQAGWSLDKTVLEDSQPTAASGAQTEQTRSAGSSGTFGTAVGADTIPGTTAVSAAGMPNGDTAVVTLAGGQEYIQWHYAADGSWSTPALINTTNSTGTHFTGITALAATATGNGMLQILSVVGGVEHHQAWTPSAGWSTFEVPVGGASNVTAVAAAGMKDGSAQFMSVIGGVEHHQIRYADGTWSTFNTLGNSGVTAVAAAGMTDGSVQFMSIVNGVAYNQARWANGSWSAFNQIGGYSGATAVAAAPGANDTAQFVVVTGGGTENWIMGNWSAGTWTSNVQLGTGVSQVALAGFNTAAGTDGWYDTTQLISLR